MQLTAHRWSSVCHLSWPYFNRLKGWPIYNSRTTFCPFNCNGGISHSKQRITYMWERKRKEIRRKIPSPVHTFPSSPYLHHNPEHQSMIITQKKHNKYLHIVLKMEMKYSVTWRSRRFQLKKKKKIQYLQQFYLFFRWTELYEVLNLINI